jgi:hypothetical protein
MINRAALIDQIQQATETLEKLLTLLRSAPVERDRFVSHLYQSRRDIGEHAKQSASRARKSSGVSSVVRFTQSGDNRGDHAIGAAISKVWVAIQSFVSVSCGG